MRENPWARGVLWLIAGILCWCGARGALSAREGLWNKGRVSYRNPGAATTAEGVQKLRKEMKKEDGGLVAGWGQQLSQFVSAPETNGSNAVDVLWTEGDAALVWDVRMLQGNLPRQGDANGCALDAHTALKLFGSCDIVGRSVKIADQWMEIRGVFALPEGLSVMGADPGRGLAFAPAVLAPGGVAMTAIEFILYIGQESPVSQVSGWMRAAGISTGGDFDTHADERGLLSLLMDVPAYMLGLCILLELYAGGAQIGKKCLKRQRLLRENRLTPARAWLRLFSVYGAGAICLLGFAALVAALMPSIRSIPPSYLPTRWSDLSFWPGLAEKGLQSWAQTALTVSLRPDMVFRTLTAWAVGLLPASVFCLWRGRSLMLRNKGAVKPARAVICFAALCAGMPAGLWLTAAAGWTPNLKTPQGMLPLILYACMLLIRVEKLPCLLEKFFSDGKKA